MRVLCAAAGAAILACNLTSFAGTEVKCGQTLDAPLRSRATLTIDSRPAGLEVVGTDKDGVHITCTADDTDGTRDLWLKLSGTTENGNLEITGGAPHHGNVKVRVEVPRKTSLRIEMGAGQVKIEEVEGDKDVDLYAGQITISSSRPWNYRSVDASVEIGEVNAQAYGVSKGGFFRSFDRKSADAEYRLHAHVLTGQIDLLGSAEHVTGQ